LGANLSYFTCPFYLIFTLYDNFIPQNRAKTEQEQSEEQETRGDKRHGRGPPTIATLQVAGQGAMTATCHERDSRLS